MAAQLAEALEVFETAWGWMALVWRRGRLLQVTLPACRETAERQAGQLLVYGGVRTPLAARLVRYFEGERVVLSAPLEFSPVSEFRRRVWELTAQIPYGEVTTYGELAKLVGSPGAARAVGGALADNPVPLVVPCHRVVAANGGLGGFSAEGGLQLKRRLLALEGVTPPWRTERGGRM